MARPRAAWPFLLLAVMAVVPVWRAVLLGEAIGPYDQIRQMAPWNGPVPEAPWDVLQADAVLQFAGWRSMVFEAWGSGELPAWNPYSLCGTPLLANSQSAGLYPPHILLGVLHVPWPLAMTLLAWFHLFAAGAGVFVLCRRLGATEGAGLLGGVMFTTSTFHVAWTALPSVVTTCAWIPWVLAGVVGVVDRGWKRIPALAVPTALLLLGGHLQFAAYGLMAAVLWLAFSAGRNPRTWACALAGLALGACLAAPQVLPTLQYAKFSHRQNTPTDDGYAAYAAGALQPFHTIGLVFPPLLGMPTEAVTQGAGKFALRLPAHWPAYVQRGGNFAESAVGIGPLAFALLFGLGVLVRARAAWRAPVALGVFGLLLAFGTPLNRLLYFYAPGWSATGSPGRAGVLFVLGACVVAALAADHAPAPASRRGWGLVSAVVGALVVSLYALRFVVPGMASWADEEPGLVGAVAAQGTAPWLPAALLAAAMACGALWAWWAKGWSIAKSLLPAAVLCPIVLGAGTLVRTSANSDLSVPDASPTTRYAFVNNSWDLLVAEPALMPPNIAGLSRIHDAGGYDSLLHRDTVQMLQGAVGQNPAPPENGNMMFIKPTYDPGRLADAGVSEVWSLVPLPRPFFDNVQGLLRREALASPGIAHGPHGAAQIAGEGFGTWVLRASGPGPLTLRDRNMPGWTATVDGVSAPIGAGLWKQVELAAGEHVVALRYTPPGLHQGLALAGGALLALLLLALVRRSLGGTRPLPVVQ